MQYINNFFASIILFSVSNIVFALDIKIAFIVDANSLKVSQTAAQEKIENWIVGLNKIYVDSGVDIRATSADIRFISMGTTEGVDIMTSMVKGVAPFSDMKQYSDRKGADFTMAVVDGLTIDGESFGGWSSLNAEYDQDADFDLARDAISCVRRLGTDKCFGSGGWLKKLWKGAVDAVEDTFKSIADAATELLQDIVEQTCSALPLGDTECKVPIPNLSEHKYFVGTINYQADSQTLAHELGHIMGLIHGEHVIKACRIVQNLWDDRGRGISAHAGGFAVGNCDGVGTVGEGGDIMAGNYVDGLTSPIFSSSKYNAKCLLNGSICGNASTADATRALNENLRYYDKQDTDVAELSYQDSNLKNCLMSKYLDKEVKGFKLLECSGMEISSLKGIEKIADLTTIDLSFNKLVDVKELLQLNPAVIQSLYLKGNNSMLCHQSEQLKAIFGSKVVLPDSCFNVGVMIAANALLMQ